MPRQLWIWFSYTGRISRTEYWLRGLLLFYLCQIGVAVCVRALLDIIAAPDTTYSVITLIYLAISFWVVTAVFAKRWHDTGKSGWWTLVFLIPFAWPVVLVYLGVKSAEAEEKRPKVRSPFLED